MSPRLLVLLAWTFFATVVFAAAQQAEEEPLRLPIVDNALWGYIDPSGMIVIQPRFHVARDFSEGLAAVREDGLYGYIDANGEWVIEPQFDVGFDFQDGIARVIVDGSPYFIDREGSKLFGHDFLEIRDFGLHTYAVVVSQGGKFGVIDRSGNLILDTIYRNIDRFSSGLSVVWGPEHHPYQYNDDDSIPVIVQVGVVDSTGGIVIPYGRYQEIERFANGFAVVRLSDTNDQQRHSLYGIVDSTGTYRFTTSGRNWDLHYFGVPFSEELGVVSIEKKDTSEDGTITSSRDKYYGVIDPSGNLLFSNQSWTFMTPFRHGHAFVRAEGDHREDEWYLINRAGDILNRVPYREVLLETYDVRPEMLFIQGKQLVRTEKGWRGIDTSGATVFVPREEPEERLTPMNPSGSILLSRDNSQTSNQYDQLYGVWYPYQNILIEPRYEEVGTTAYGHRIVAAVEDGRMMYINDKGSPVWREAPSVKTGPLNIDYMRWAYSLAASPHREETYGAGGWYESPNRFRSLDSLNRTISGSALQILPVRDDTTVWSNRNTGMKLLLCNTTSETYYFDASDSRLYLNIQAQDRNGEWKDIEAFLNSWCGHSYHMVFLPPHAYWEFTIPEYEGSFRTKLRAKLLYREAADSDEELTLYSSEFEGSVNPGQFSHRQDYHPGGIMDPYDSDW